MSSERTAPPVGISPDELFLYAPTNGNAGGKTGNGEGVLSWNTPDGATKASVEKRENEEFERGVKEGESRARSAAQTEIVATKAAISAAIAKFKSERETYFSRVEPEVVQLALAIARKILHREAQMDPLLLAGMVHVALDKIGTGTSMRLWANPADIPFWNEHFSKLGSSELAPELIGDPALKRGECALETEGGSTHISLDAQLKEIEQGFFDLLEQRPQVR